MRILVTGGTGLLGNNVIRQGLDAGHSITALSRTPSPKSLESLPIDLFIGELTDAESLSHAVRSVDAIIHCAAHIHIGWWYLQESLDVNEKGTRVLAELARVNGKRFVHVSTVDTLAIATKKQIASEETPGDGQIPSSYVLSKRAAEEVVKKEIALGLDGVLVHPGFMIGPWDWKPSSGRMITAIAQSKWLAVTPIGGCSVCDVRDVAQGVLAALTRGERGRNYILAGYNVRYFQFWCQLATLLGRPKPIFTPRLPWRVLGGLVGDLRSRLRGKESDFNSAGIRASAQFHWYSSERAKNELGYQNRPLEETLDDAIHWLRENGYLEKETKR